MFKKILFATSATQACDHAARVAFNISRLYKAHLTILHVLEPATPGATKGEADEKTMAQFRQKIETDYAEQLPKTPSHGIKTPTGIPFEEILSEILTDKPDLVVMGVSTQGEASAADHMETAGSTLIRVAKASTCPLLIVNRAAASFWGTISNVIFTTDFSKASDHAFEFACKLARSTDCELHVFHVQTLSLTPDSQIFNQDAVEERIREKLRFFRKKYVSKMEGIENYTIEVWEGTPYIEIVKYAREKFADLIIMAHDSQNPGTQTDEMGSNIKQVILRAGCPVLCMNKHNPI